MTSTMDTTSSATKPGRTPAAPEKILDVVIELLESVGFDKLQLNDVASRARTSLATIYRHYPSRNELIVAALERWMAEHSYKDLAEPSPDDPVFDALMQTYRKIFEPWEGHPRLVEALVRAMSTDAGGRLWQQGMDEAIPATREVFGRFDQEYVDDVSMILTYVGAGAMAQIANGGLQVTELIPIVERTVRRMSELLELRGQQQRGDGRSVLKPRENPWDSRRSKR